MLVAALLLAATWTIDVPIALHAHAPVANAETAIEPAVALRVGRTFDVVDVDAALWLLGAGQGTSQVSSSKWLVFGEARALWSWGIVSSTFSALSAYAFTGAGAGGGAAQVTAFGDARTHSLFTWHARGGGGLELRTHGVVTRVELGGGVRDLAPEVTSALAIGVRF